MTMSETRYVGVARFSGIDGAERAFSDAHDWDPAADWMDDAAFVEVHRDDRIVVRGSVAGHYVEFGPSAFAVGLVGGATAGGAVEASRVAEPEGPVFDAIRAQVPEGSSAVVVVSTAGRVRAMSEAIAGVAENFEDHPLSPAAEADLRSALADARASRRRG
jgi:hypothetical protein